MASGFVHERPCGARLKGCFFHVEGKASSRALPRRGDLGKTRKGADRTKIAFMGGLAVVHGAAVELAHGRLGSRVEVRSLISLIVTGFTT